MHQTGPLFIADIIERVNAIADSYLSQDHSSADIQSADQPEQKLHQPNGEPNGPPSTIQRPSRGHDK